MSKTEQLNKFKAFCQAKGMKVTPQRLFIYEELLGSDDHPSAEMLYTRLKSKLPTVTLDTVYRALNVFSEIGVASIVEGTGGSRRFEGNLDVHHHVRCLKCDKIMDVYSPAYDQLSVPPEVKQDFEVLKTTVHIVGMCRACKQAEVETTGKSTER